MRKKQDMLYLQEISQKKEGTYYDRENKKTKKMIVIPTRENRNSVIQKMGRRRINVVWRRMPE